MELSGTDEIDMRFGRPLVAGGAQVMLKGQSGVVFKQTPEAEALARWQRREFLEVERLIAKGWREALSNLELETTYQRRSATGVYLRSHRIHLTTKHSSSGNCGTGTCRSGVSTRQDRSAQVSLAPTQLSSQR